MISAKPWHAFALPRSISTRVDAVVASVERATRVIRLSCKFVSGAPASHEPPESVAVSTRFGHPITRFDTSSPQRKHDLACAEIDGDANDQQIATGGQAHPVMRERDDVAQIELEPLGQQIESAHEHVAIHAV